MTANPDTGMENIRVECYSGYRGEETPRRFWLGPRCIEIRRLLDLWLAPEHRYFKVLGDDNGVYILRHDASREVWEMTFFRQLSSPSED